MPVGRTGSELSSTDVLFERSQAKRRALAVARSAAMGDGGVRELTRPVRKAFEGAGRPWARMDARSWEVRSMSCVYSFALPELHLNVVFEKFATNFC
jgi:hypothetical protein